MDDNQPTSNSLRRLRRAYSAQRYGPDLSALVNLPGAASARGMSVRAALALAAALMVCLGVGWIAALLLESEKPGVATNQTTPQPQRSPSQLTTLELSVEPRPRDDGDPVIEPTPAQEHLERRPVLPGILVFSTPRAPAPPRPQMPRRPSLPVISSKTNAETQEQGPMP